MSKKLTITVSEEVYAGLHQVIGRRKISRFIEEIARPHVIPQDLAAAYREMAMDESREAEALEWSEAVLPDCIAPLGPSASLLDFEGWNT
jgi:predicted CopG family antitoxin